jgi:hypothetical protein
MRKVCGVLFLHQDVGRPRPHQTTRKRPLVSGSNRDVPKGNMDKNPIQKVRHALYERLQGFDFTQDALKDKSLFQLVTLTHLLVGHLNCVGTYTCSWGTLEELFGDQFWHREEKPEDVVREVHEPRPKPVVN